MTAVSCDYIAQANEAFVDDNFELAIDLYSKALEENDNSEILIKRSSAYFKLEKFKESKLDAIKALEIGYICPKSFYRKGIACYHLGDYGEAETAFIDGQQLGEETTYKFTEWIEKCRVHLKKNGSENLCRPATKITHNWYQTDSQVVITIFVKQIKPENVRIDFAEAMLNCVIRLSEESDYSLHLENLSHAIVPQQCTWKAFSSKIEIKLKKAEAVMWKNLEGDTDALQKVNPVEVGDAKANSYPSSCAQKKDWDQIIVDIKKEEENDKLEGDAALNQLFQKIYSEGSDEVKKAMNKSFMESGGTVLSTNWNEVGNKQVEVKPPDGMEWKNWEQ